MEQKNIYPQRLAWNDNEIVNEDAPLHGIAGIAPDQDDSFAEEIVRRWNLYDELLEFSKEWASDLQCQILDEKDPMRQDMLRDKYRNLREAVSKAEVK